MPRAPLRMRVVAWCWRTDTTGAEAAVRRAGCAEAGRTLVAGAPGELLHVPLPGEPRGLSPTRGEAGGEPWSVRPTTRSVRLLPHRPPGCNLGERASSRSLQARRSGCSSCWLGLGLGLGLGFGLGLGLGSGLGLELYG